MCKMRAFILLLLSGFLIEGCSDSGDNSSTVLSDDLAGSVYRGVIPCADCEGILYKLSLDKDNSFETSSIYIGKSNRPFIDHGSWKVEDTLLVLQGDSGNTRTLAVGDSILTILDGDQKPITGSLADHYVLQKKMAPADSTRQRWTDLRKKGIDFRASGNEPFWSVQIDFDKMMTFKMLDGDSITTPVPEMQRDTASQARVLTATTESGSLTVKLYPTRCVDNMSGEVFSHGINVEYEGKTYRGCGNLINDKYQLHDFWILHSFDGKEVKQYSLTKMPTLNLDLPKNRISGNSGCNRLTGDMELQGDSLSFGQLASTKMACQGSMDFEDKFLKALEKVESYDIENGELKLSGKDKVLMVFYYTE